MSIPARFRSLLRPVVRAVRGSPRLYLAARLGKVCLTNGPREALARRRVFLYEQRCAKRADGAPILMYHEWDEQRKACEAYPAVFSAAAVLREASGRWVLELAESFLQQSNPRWHLLLIDQRGDSARPELPELKKLLRKESRIQIRSADPSLPLSALCAQFLSPSISGVHLIAGEDAFLHPSALYFFAKEIHDSVSDFLFADEIAYCQDVSDAHAPFFKPEYNAETLRSYNYVGPLFCFSPGLLSGIFSDEEPAWDTSYDLILRLCERAGRPRRVPETLCYVRHTDPNALGHFPPKESEAASELSALEAHLRRAGLPGQVREGAYPFLHRISYEITGNPKVSILIPNRDHPEDLKKCVESIRRRSTWPNWEVLILENGSQSSEIRDYYRELSSDPRFRILTWTETFNFSAVCNFGAKHARGEMLLLLNNDTEVITPDWMEQMIMFAQRPEIGAVGAKLLYADGTVQHAGIIIDPIFTSFHHFRHTPAGDPGYAWRLQTAQAVSAATGACLMVRRGLWEQAGGLDEAFTVTYNDTDFCMKLRSLGLTNIWTPYAELYHHELKSRGADVSPEKAARSRREAELFASRWKAEIAAGDPAWSPRLAGRTLSPGTWLPWSASADSAELNQKDGAIS